MSKLHELELDEQSDMEVCDPCQSLALQTSGPDFSYIISDITGRIEKRFKDGHVEPVEPYSAYDPYSGMAFWD